MIDLAALTQKQHRANVGALRCVITGQERPTLHHAQGPSIKERLAELGLDGVKSLSMRGAGEALLLPLAAEYHTGRFGIDGAIGRATWETVYGGQADMIDRVSLQLGYDMWELHKLWTPKSKIFRRR